MNLSVKGFGIYGSAVSGFPAGGKLPGIQDMTLKSTQEAMKRAQKAAGQIDFWEERKAGLKNMECGSAEEIAEKLDMFHTYEDEIAAAKMAYNHEQMFHLMDEARERGEKIAEAVEKMEPKTPEERREELAEEALGTEDGDGMPEEVLEEAEEILEEIQEEVLEETAEASGEDVPEETMEASGEEVLEGASKVPGKGMPKGTIEAPVEDVPEKPTVAPDREAVETVPEERDADILKGPVEKTGEEIQKEAAEGRQANMSVELSDMQIQNAAVRRAQAEKVLYRPFDLRI